MDAPKVEVTLTDEPTTHATTKHYSVTLRDGNDELQGSARVFTIGYAGPQDVCDVVAYAWDDNTLKIGVNTSIRPVLAAREALGVSPHSGLLRELPGTIILHERGHSSIEQAVQDVCNKKLGVKTVGGIESLGGSYALSVGTSTEFSFPRAVQVEPKEQTLEGSTFGRWRKVDFVSVQEIINGYCAGSFEDTRLIENAFRLAQLKGIHLSAPLNLSSVTKDFKSDLGSRIIGVGEGQRILRSKHGRIAHVDAQPCDAPENPYLRTQKLQVKNIGEQGVMDEYSVDMIVRKGIDAIDVGCYSWENNKLYMHVKLGARPALAVRNYSNHPIHADVNPLMFEGIAISSQGEKGTAEILASAIRAAKKEVGFSPAASPVLVGSDFPSAGYSCERVHRVLLEVDPRNDSVVADQDTADTYAVEINDLLALEKQGAIRDPRVILNARLIKAAFAYPDRVTSIRPDDEALAAHIDRGSELQACLYKHCPNEDQTLSRNSDFRRLKTYCENELGLLIYDFDHPEEKHFFSASVPIMAMPHPKDPRKLAFYIAHDFRHYTSGDYVPWRLESGKLVPTSYEEFAKMLSHDECDAVHFSDVFVPQVCGIDEAERLFGGLSVAGAFRILGMDDVAARKAIISIERDGVIPQNILQSDRYEELRPVIVDRLLRYHISDKHHTKIIHDNWMQNPEFGLAALRFCNAFNTPESYVRSFEESLAAIQNYSEGVNPLRALVSRTNNNDVRLAALHMAHLSGYVTRADAPGSAAVVERLRKHIDRLEAVSHTLRSMLPMVRDIDVSPNNIAVYRAVTGLRDSVISDARRKINEVYASRFITPAQRAHDEGRIMPYFPNLAAVDEEKIRRETYALEAAQR